MAANDKLKSNRKMPNAFGQVPTALKNVSSPDKASALVAGIDKAAPKELKETSKKIVECIKQMFDDQNQYQTKLDARVIDQNIGRITKVLDDAMASVASEEDLKSLKEDIIDGIKQQLDEAALKSILGSIIVSTVSSAFDEKLKDSNVGEIKAWIQENLPSRADVEDALCEASKEDNKKGEYLDSTPAENFYTLQDYVNGQFDQLNKNIQNIAVQPGLIFRMSKSIGTGFSKVLSGVKKVTSVAKNAVAGIASVTAVVGKGIVNGIAGAIGGISKGIGSLAKGIGSLGSKVGSFIASPFKKIGGFFKSLNPFSKAKEKAEERKEKAKNKVFDVIAKIIDKIWTAIEPFIDKVLMYFGLIQAFVIVPIAIIMTKVLLVTAAIVALGVGLYLAYKLIKEKALELWNYVVSGKLWKDIKSGLLKLWEWSKDFGKWIWDKLCQFGKWYLKTLVKVWKFILIDVPLWIWDKLCEFGKWLWDKLCEFGKWLYDNYIDKYLVQPFMKYVWNPLKELWEKKVWPMIEPFVKSLSELKDKIVQAFSAWDTNKSIWENLKNISGIIVDAVVEWWDKSPFKEFYEKYLEPHIQSLGNLIQRIKSIWSKFKWDENKSFLENLKGLASTIKEGVLEWWRDKNNPIRKLYNTRIKPIIDMLKEKLQPFIDKFKELINKLGNMTWDLGRWIGIIRPFGFLVGKTFKLSEAEAEEFTAVTSKNKEADSLNDDIEELKKLRAEGKTDLSYWSNPLLKAKYGSGNLDDIIAQQEKRRDALRSSAAKELERINSRNLAQQQMAKPIQQVDSISNMNAQSSENLAVTSSAMSAKVEQKEQQQQQRWQQNDALQYSILKELRDTRAEVNKYGKDPTAVGVPMPYGPVQNSAVIN